MRKEDKGYYLLNALLLFVVLALLIPSALLIINFGKWATQGWY